jgi:DNA-binding transcriptional regulator LsrR (DeoR family)
VAFCGSRIAVLCEARGWRCLIERPYGHGDRMIAAVETVSPVHNLGDSKVNGRETDLDALPNTAEESKVRAAWHYYIEGKTQERIAELLGVSRLKVHRLLAAARDEGIIQFRVSHRLAECISLEQRLCERYGLTEAVVVPKSIDPAKTHEMVAQAASIMLSNSIGEGMTVAIGWGRTLHYAIRRFPSRDVPGVTILSMLGGLARAQPLNPTECAWNLAEKLGAECHMLPVPAYADDPGDRDAFMQQRGVREVINRTRRADLALISVGALTPESPIGRYGFLGVEEIEELRAAGATGDLLCQFLDEQGDLIDHDVNRRVCAFPVSELARIPKIILASGGREKISVLRAALNLTKASIFVTDETAATGLLRY